MSSKKRILFIINPISGIRKNEKQRLPFLIKKYLDQDIFEYSIRFTQSAGHATELSQEAVENGYDIVVSVGGDGSVNEIAQCLVNTPVTLAIMPFGSGNGLARHLGIPLNPKKALNIINQLKTGTIDVGMYAADKYFFSNVGIGLAVNVVKWFEHHQVRGFLSYALAVVRGFFSVKPISIKIEVNGKILERDVYIFNICNSNQYGYGVGLAPAAKLDDGVLDIGIISYFPRWHFPLYAIFLLIKKHHWIPTYELHSSATCRLLNEQEKYLTLQVDGELSRFKENWEVKVLPGALKVLMP